MKQPKLRTSKLAEFTGLMLGDGSIGKYTCKKEDGTTKTQRSITITLSSKEKDFANQIHALIKDLFNIEMNERVKKNENVRELRTFRKDIFEFVTNQLGLKVSPKWNRCKLSLKKY